jgi:hypothetical protein
MEIYLKTCYQLCHKITYCRFELLTFTFDTTLTHYQLHQEIMV